MSLVDQGFLEGELIPQGYISSKAGFGSIITQGFLGNLLITQGYGFPFVPPPLIPLNANIITEGWGLGARIITQGYAVNTQFFVNNPDVFHISRFSCDCDWSITKRAAESIPIDFDVSAALPLGVRVAVVNSITATTVTVPPLVFMNSVVNDAPVYYRDSNTTVPIGQIVQFTVSGGLAATSPQAALLAPYSINMIYTSTDGATRQATGCLAVIDNSCIC